MAGKGLFPPPKPPHFLPEERVRPVVTSGESLTKVKEGQKFAEGKLQEEVSRESDFRSFRLPLWHSGHVYASSPSPPFL